MSERTNPYTKSDEGEPEETRDEDKDYLVYIANLMAGTNRRERITIEFDEDTTPEASARRLLKDNEEIIKVEECKPRRYRAMIEVKKLYRVFIEGEDIDDEAHAEVTQQIQDYADAKWEDRCHNEAKLLSLEEVD